MQIVRRIADRRGSDEEELRADRSQSERVIALCAAVSEGVRLVDDQQSLLPRLRDESIAEQCIVRDDARLDAEVGEGLLPLLDERCRNDYLNRVCRECRGNLRGDK